MGTRLRPQGKQQYFDASGNPASGYKVYTYEPGTSTPKATWVDNAQSAANTNPVILDSRGEADIWWSGIYKIRYTDNNDVEIWSVDNYGAGEDDAQTTATSMVANHSFEIDTTGDNLPDNWDIVNYSGSTNQVVTTEQDHGQKSMEFTSTGSGGGYITTSAFMEVSPNQPLAFGFSIKSSVVDVRNVVQVLWYTELKIPSGTASTDVYDEDTNNPTAWTAFPYHITPPSDAYYCKVRMYGAHSSDATPGTIWYDNIILSPYPGLNALLTQADEDRTAIGGRDTEDLDTIVEGGFYQISSTSANNPAGSWGVLLAAVRTAVPGVERRNQLFMGDDTPELWYRSYSSSGWNAWFKIAEDGFPKGHLWGSIEYRDTSTMFFNPTECRSEDNTTDIILTAQLVKNTAVAWVEGSFVGGAFTTLGNDAWAYPFLIRKDSDGTIDAGYDTDINAANRPAGWTAYRRVGAIYLDAGNDVRPFTQNGDRFLWDVPIKDMDNNAPGTAANIATLSTPVGLELDALVSFYGRDNNVNTGILLTSLDQTDTVPSNVGPNTINPSLGPDSAHIAIKTNTSSQVRYRSTTASLDDLILQTRGWIDTRNRLN